jgi:hypothetical protein
LFSYLSRYRHFTVDPYIDLVQILILIILIRLVLYLLCYSSISSILCQNMVDSSQMSIFLKFCLSSIYCMRYMINFRFINNEKKIRIIWSFICGHGQGIPNVISSHETQYQHLTFCIKYLLYAFFYIIVPIIEICDWYYYCQYQVLKDDFDKRYSRKVICLKWSMVLLGGIMYWMVF